MCFVQCASKLYTAVCSIDASRVKAKQLIIMFKSYVNCSIKHIHKQGRTMEKLKDLEELCWLIDLGQVLPQY